VGQDGVQETKDETEMILSAPKALTADDRMPYGPYKMERMEDTPKRKGYWTGKKHSEASKIRMAFSQMGRKHSPETKAKISISQKGKIITLEARAKLRAANLGKVVPPHVIEKIRKSLERTKAQRAISASKTLRGRKKSPEHKAKIAAALKGKIRTPEHCAKISIASRLNRCGHHKRTPEMRAKMSASTIKSIAAKGADSRKNTSIEREMQRQLSLLGVQYVSSCPVAGFLVDIYIPSHGIVIECDGCFWHCCEQCGHQKNPKMTAAIKAKDRNRDAALKQNGYTVLRFWEHDINTDSAKCATVVINHINGITA